MGRRDPYLSTHPLTPDRIAAFEEAAARSPYANTPDSPQFLDMHHRMVAKLMGFIDARASRCSATPRATAPCRRATPAPSRSTARAALGSALLTIDGLLKEYPNDPYFHELRGQMLFENGRAAESVPSYRRAVQLLPAVGIAEDRLGARPARNQQAGQRSRGGAQPRARRRRPSRAASNCGG